MRAALVFLACLVALVAAQEPQRCIAIRQFEAREASFDYEMRFAREAKFGYDADNERFYRYDEVEFNSTRGFYHDIYLHQENVQYHIDLRARTCERRPLTRPFYPIGIPEEARFYSSRYLGSGGVPSAGLLTTVWFGEETDHRYDLVFTERECLPVHITRFFSQSIERSSFFDVSIGIANPDGFIPPPECQQPSNQL